MTKVKVLKTDRKTRRMTIEVNGQIYKISKDVYQYIDPNAPMTTPWSPTMARTVRAMLGLTGGRDE